MARIGEGEECIQILVGKPEGKRSLGRRRRIWDNNIKMNYKNCIGWQDWIDLVQHRDKWQAVVSTAMHSRVPLNVGNFLTS